MALDLGTLRNPDTNIRERESVRSAKTDAGRKKNGENSSIFSSTLNKKNTPPSKAKTNPAPPKNNPPSNAVDIKRATASTPKKASIMTSPGVGKQQKKLPDSLKVKGSSSATFARTHAKAPKKTSAPPVKESTSKPSKGRNMSGNIKKMAKSAVVIVSVRPTHAQPNAEAGASEQRKTEASLVPSESDALTIASVPERQEEVAVLDKTGGQTSDVPVKKSAIGREDEAKKSNTSDPTPMAS